MSGGSCPTGRFGSITRSWPAGRPGVLRSMTSSCPEVEVSLASTSTSTVSPARTVPKSSWMIASSTRGSGSCVTVIVPSTGADRPLVIVYRITLGLGSRRSVRGMIRTQRPLSTATCSWPPSSPASASTADCTTSMWPDGSASLASTSTMAGAVPRTVTWSGDAVGVVGPASATSTRMLPWANLAAPNLAVYSRK